MLPATITLPTAAIAGTYVIAAEPPQVVIVDYALPRTVIGADSDGELHQLPAAEGAILAMLSGFDVPEPMTLGLTLFDLADGRRVFVCTELAENKGVSVTNAWPDLARQLIDLAGDAKPETAVFIEHYCDASYRQPIGDETFDLVEIEWAGQQPVNCGWRRLQPIEAPKRSPQP